MSIPYEAVIAIVALLVLIALRVPIAVALLLVSFSGVASILGVEAALRFTATIPQEFAASWELSAVPMFLLMGGIAYHSGMTNSLYHAARVWLSWLPGGLAVATNFACAGFGATSGSSLATTVAMGRIGVPEMLKYRYDPGLATGACASAGTLAGLIPPSIGMIIYGILAEQSVARLFIAGILPGLLTAASFAALIIVRCRLNPELAPPALERQSWNARLSALREIWPLPVLILIVLGGLYGGYFGPTEAGAIGAGAALMIALFQRRLTFSAFRHALAEAARTTAIIMFVAVGAVLLARYLALIGLPGALTEIVGSWSSGPLALIAVTALVYLVLGMFLDPLSMVLLTLPVFLPLYEVMNINLIWFGILLIKFVEVGLMTPPLGLNVYAVKTVAPDDIDLSTIFRGTLWFLIPEAIVIGLLILFPGIVLWLPSLMR